MKLAILRSVDDKILCEWNADQILQYLKDSFDNIPKSAIYFNIIKEPENKVLYSVRIKNIQMFTLDNVTNELESSFLKMIEEFKEETIKLR